MKIAIIGIGFVGSAILKSFKKHNLITITYDKYKSNNNSKDNLINCLNTDILYMCLPTEFNNKKNKYNKKPIYEVCKFLSKNNYQGIILNKSTVEPNTHNKLCKKYNNLKFIHNPEFLSSKTAFEDFHNQKHVVLGKTNNVSNQDVNIVKKFYKDYYPKADISICESNESESMKIFCNSFYAVKIQFFNELYLLCQKTNCDYDTVLKLMLNNNWINPMHTNVPGRDGKLSYGGACFPKDTNALLSFMKKNNSNHQILESCISERNIFRKIYENKEYNFSINR